jgi:hypothetical protein
MALDWMTLEALTASWGAAPKMAAFRDLAATARGLRAPPAAAEAVEASYWMAMQFGDTGAPELCVIVVAHRQQFELAPRDRGRLEAQRAFALLSLGLGTTPDPHPRIADIERVTKIEEPRVQAFLDDLLAPVGGSLERAVDLAFRLLALRQGVCPRPAHLTIESVLALPDPVTTVLAGPSASKRQDQP